MLKGSRLGIILLSAIVLLGGTTFASTIRDVKLKLVYPKAGIVLMAGQVIQVKWRARIPKDLDLTWCEQEAFLSVDGGKTFVQRISGQLSPRIHTFEWIVPDLPTRKAVLNLRFGSDGGPGRLEASHIQSKNVFEIVSPAVPPQTVSVSSVSSAQGRPGQEIKLNWRSSVKDIDRYDVLISYNAGGHFNLLGSTKRQDFLWQVPTAFAGHATFKVVAVTRSGLRIESGVSARPQVIVQ